MKNLRKAFLISMLSILITGCPSVNNEKSSSEVKTSSTSQTSSTINESTTSSKTTSSIIVNSSVSSSVSSNNSSNSSLSSSTSTKLVEKTLSINPSNFNTIKNIDLIDVVENKDYPEEFTFNVGGVMKSNKYKGLKKIKMRVYSTYENLKVYKNYQGTGTPLTAIKDTGTNEATYTYNFNNENEFYIVNESPSYRTHVYSIEITYLDVVSGGSQSSTSTSSSNNNNNNNTSNGGVESDHYNGTYYNNTNLNLTGSSLKTELRELITETHDDPTSYDDLKKYLPQTDASLTNPSKMVLIYSRTEVTGSWDNAATWNREHVWPKANGWFKESGAGSDLHHIRPEDPNVNSKRGNTKFGTGSSYYEPVNAAKGDVARIIFYLLTRYSQSDSYGVTKVAQSMDLLLKWNELDPVDGLEIQRNKVAEKVQGNRNPFIDYPELADVIW